MKNITIYWILAIFITLGAAYYQRATGPTYPKKVKININKQSYSLKLPRSYGGNKDCEINLPIPDFFVNANLYYRRYPTNDNWSKVEFVRQGKELIAKLPHQPPAGKLQYHIKLLNTSRTHYEELEIAKKTPVIIRFKGNVPAFILIPHIILMFAAMLIANLAGLLALVKNIKYKLYTNITFFLLLIGGLILGPIVQQYAFGELWTGIPFGWDLTDNKILIAFLFWFIAVIGNRKKQRLYLTIIAAIVLFLIYSIPHSMFGSELDYSSGHIVTGME